MLLQCRVSRRSGSEVRTNLSQSTWLENALFVEVTSLSFNTNSVLGLAISREHRLRILLPFEKVFQPTAHKSVKIDNLCESNPVFKI